jgi:hypothetical protein
MASHASSTFYERYSQPKSIIPPKVTGFILATPVLKDIFSMMEDACLRPQADFPVECNLQIARRA